LTKIVQGHGSAFRVGEGYPASILAMISRQSPFSSLWGFSDCAANECQKLLFSEWLQQVTVRSIAHYFFSDLRIVYGSNVSEWNARVMLLHVQEKREPVYQR